MGYGAVLEADMAVCVESYIGELGGHEGSNSRRWSG